VSFLRALRLLFELAHLVVVLAEHVFDRAADLAQRVVGQVDRVGSHVGDVPGLVERLRDLHRLPHWEAEP
jgi:hypothetical protein